MDVHHTAIWVSDPESTIEFYEDVLGLEKSQEFVDGNGVTSYCMSGESDTEIQFMHDENGDVAVDSETIDHLAITVEDVDAAVDRAVEEWDSTLANSPQDITEMSARIAFITDPDGYPVEIIQQL